MAHAAALRNDPHGSFGLSSLFSSSNVLSALPRSTTSVQTWVSSQTKNESRKFWHFTKTSYASHATKWTLSINVKHAIEETLLNVHFQFFSLETSHPCQFFCRNSRKWIPRMLSPSQGLFSCIDEWCIVDSWSKQLHYPTHGKTGNAAPVSTVPSASALDVFDMLEGERRLAIGDNIDK
jgi:hypothetical protein